MTTPAVVSASFTSVTTSSTLVVKRGANVAIALSGTYAATVQVERATSPDETSFEVVAGPFKTANATVAQGYTATKTEEHLRLRCTSFTSGTAVASLTATAVQGVAIADPSTGAAAVAITEDGVAFEGGAEFGPPVAAGSTITLSEGLHAGRTILLDTAAGCTVTLPKSTGKGAVYKFVMKTKATSNNHIVKVGNTTDIIQGMITTMSDDPATAKAFAAGSTDDTITLNRTTTGSTQVGEYLEIIDYAAGFFAVHGMTASTGTEATPFSSTV